MTTPQKDFLNMLLKVKTFFANNAAAVASFALLTPMIAKVSDFIADILAADVEASRDITGAAEKTKKKWSASLPLWEPMWQPACRSTMKPMATAKVCARWTKRNTL